MSAKAHRARLDAIAQMVCVACEIDGAQQPSRTECHHVVDRGTRRHSGGHDSTIPLCDYHHRGVPSWGVSVSEMAVRFGPSLALEKRRFKHRYGDERELLALINARLAAVA